MGELTCNNKDTPVPAPGAALLDRQQQALAVIQQFRMILGTVKHHAEWVEKHSDVTAAQLWAMWELVEHPGLRVSELAQALSIHRSTASNLIDKLEKKGMVRKERRGPDQRSVCLNLTESGLSVAHAAPRPARGVLQETVRQLPDLLLARLHQDLTELIGYLTRIDRRTAYTPLADLLGQDNNNNE